MKKRSRSKTKFEYRPASKEHVKRRATQSSGAFDNYIREEFEIFTPPEGDNIVRILPGTWLDAPDYSYDIWVHYGIGADNQAYLCLNRMKNKPCPLCEARATAEQQGETDVAKDLKPTKRVAAWIIDRKDEDAGPVLWPMPITIDKEIEGRRIHKRTGEILPIDDPNEGYDIEFHRKGTALNTKYTGVDISRDSSSLHDDPDVVDEWIDFIVENELPSAFVYYTYEQISNAYNARPIEQPEDDKEEEIDVDDDKPWDDDEEEDVDKEDKDLGDDEEEEEEDSASDLRKKLKSRMDKKRGRSRR